ncbi:hypothetical protein DSTSK_36170 [Desulforhabdus sp. TSK]|nr:hypothetical protein DSTSK_36170 [Desulforhabdus sp. TSK]
MTPTSRYASRAAKNALGIDGPVAQDETQQDTNGYEENGYAPSMACGQERFIIQQGMTTPQNENQCQKS